MWFWFRSLEGCETVAIKRATKRHVAGLEQMKRIWEALVKVKVWLQGDPSTTHGLPAKDRGKCGVEPERV